MSKTNTLISHHPERLSNRIDKMSPTSKSTSWLKDIMRGYSKKFYKKFASKKRRQLLKQNNEKKI